LSTLLNKSARENNVKYFSRMSRKLAHSTNMCFTVSGIPQDWQVGDHPGWAGARRELLDFMAQGKINRGRHTHTIRLGATPSGLTSAHLHHPPIFYRPDALPAAQPTVSRHWRQTVYKSNWTNFHETYRRFPRKTLCLQCSDTVGWTSGRAFGLCKIFSDEVVAWLCLEWDPNDLHIVQLIPLPRHHLLFD